MCGECFATRQYYSTVRKVGDKYATDTGRKDRKIHPEWNDRWQGFFDDAADAGRKPTASEAQDFATELIGEFRLDQYGPRPLLTPEYSWISPMDEGTKTLSPEDDCYLEVEEVVARLRGEFVYVVIDAERGAASAKIFFTLVRETL